MNLNLDPSRHIEFLAADIFHDVMRRLGLPHTWYSPDTVKRRWIAVAEMVREIVASVPKSLDGELRTEAEKMLNFVSGTDFTYCGLSTQREARERLYALRRALK